MCKVAGVTGINDNNRNAVWDFMKDLGVFMTVYNNHGLGYSAFDKSGNIFGEKWLYNKDAFREVSSSESVLSSVRKDYAYFGDSVKRDEARGIILHTRMATCTRNIENTHPFVDNFDSPKFSLIHNGVIYNDNKLTKKHSTCDSEVILHEYIKYKCDTDLKNIQKVADELYGWYTCFMLTKDKNNKPVMDIFSDSGRLDSYFIKELDCRVYSSNARDIERVANHLGYTLQNGMGFSAGTMKRLDVDSGDCLFKGDFNPDKKATENTRGYWSDADFDNWFIKQVEKEERGE